MWGKKLHHLHYRLDELISTAIQQHGRSVEVHAVIYWNGNELVGPGGIEDEPRYPFRPSCLDVASVYDRMHERLERLARIAKRCETFSLVTETVLLKLGNFRDLKDIQIYLEDLFFTFMELILSSS